jgi:hypothetical protein
MELETMREIADALDTAYGCLDLMKSGIKIVDLDLCIAEVKDARDEAVLQLEAMVAAAHGT